MSLGSIRFPPRCAVWVLRLACLLSCGCAKIVEGGCASDDDCRDGVRCNRDTHRCLLPDAGQQPCTGAMAGEDDPACGIIDCDGLDDACADQAYEQTKGSKKPGEEDAGAAEIRSTNHVSWRAA